MINQKNQIHPLPFHVYFSIIAFLAIAGFLDSLYLSWSHYRNYTDISYQSFCAISKAYNCDTVSQSPYSIFWGMPLAVWGMTGYSFLILLMLLLWQLRAQRERIWTLIFIISFIFSMISIVLAFVSTFYIRSYCIMCILSFGINFLLLYFTWLIRNRFGVTNFFNALKQDFSHLWINRKISALLFIPFFCCIFFAIIFFPKYWDVAIPVNYSDMSVGVTPDGYQWIGAENPELTIIEFTDYQCFGCKKMHFYLRNLIKKNPGRIRLVHRYYPMDSKYNFAVKNTFHENSGVLALIAIYASTKGKFWETNDILYNLKNKDFSLSSIAHESNLDIDEVKNALKNPVYLNKLRIDLWEGYKLGIKSTPAYVINGKVYKSTTLNDVIKESIGNSD
jgi:uncharacterized membrane protein/protein-disulfide isomerase